ncbi:MAG TPA: sigma-70 family RNA polymerase sigma factor [Rhizomicrobium sp.]|jgi:RNA polymerase sigma-70 factor (ECF subfamily)|nr:sigma-70 family RNA polymerase sigma factor [Rhizomicrobium sp.]
MSDNFAIAGGMLLPKAGGCCTLSTLFGSHHQMSDKEWSAWMAAAQKGDGARYRRLLGEIRPWLKRYFSARLPPSMVDDAVQDTLVALHEKRNSYDPLRPFGPWLVAIARYKWIDRLRALRRSAALPISEDIAIEDHGAAVQSATTLEKLLGELKPAQAEVIRLVKMHGFSVEEASAKTGQSVSLVKVNIHRGITRMMIAAQRQVQLDG